ncbi:MAG: glycoside hydrolase family 57 protein [Candidatus Nanoarchaeia archaeon]
MTNICWYFQVHQPFRIRQYRIYDIEHNHDYFDDRLNYEEFLKVSYKCYLPMNQLLLKLLKKHPELKVSFSISGVALEQMEKYIPEVLESFKELVKTDQVELLSETYYHSLSALYSKEEFYEQISQHQKIIKHHFGVEPLVFRNTELIYSNDISNHIANLGFKGMLLEGWGPEIDWRNQNFVYQNHSKTLKLLAKNYNLSEDIQFRFSNTSWKHWPLDAQTYSDWIHKTGVSGDIVNLFLDYETFGELHTQESGIFNFIEYLPQALLENENTTFMTPSEAIEIDAKESLHIENPISWNNEYGCVYNWRGNKMQEEALHDLYSIESDIKKYGTLQEIQSWKKLTTSNHFYDMSTQYFEDGKDAKRYSSHHSSPYDAYIYMKNIIKDLRQSIMKRKKHSIQLQEIQKGEVAQI